MTVTLRDYQEDAVAGVRGLLREHGAVLLVLPTGGGKTICFSYIAANASQRGRTVFILAHLDTLLKQASNKLRDCGLDHGIISPAFTPALYKRVQVASVQTLVRRLEKVKKAPDLLIIDECHLSSAASYIKVVAHFLAMNPQMKVLGVTATASRLDGKGLRKGGGGLFEALYCGVSFGEMIRRAFLCRPVVYASPNVLDLSGVKKKGGDYDSSSLAEAMDKPKITGDAVEHYQRICPGVPAIAWCANVAHAQHVAAEFNARGITALALSGENDTKERDDALAALAAGTVKVVTFAMLLVAGVDCPAIKAIIMLRPTMSLASYLQTVGRGSRPIYAPGMPQGTIEERLAAMDAGPKGRTFFVLDHAGLVFKHGFAEDEREWSLDGLKKKAGKKKKQDDTLDLKQCPKCHIIHHPEPVCPGCGHVYQTRQRTLEHEDGELQEITPEKKAEMAKARQIEVGKAKTLEELQEIAKQRGYSERWADHVFKAKAKKAEKKGGGFRRPEPPPEAYEQDLFRP